MMAVAWMQMIRLSRGGRLDALRRRYFLLVAGELAMMGLVVFIHLGENVKRYGVMVGSHQADMFAWFLDWLTRQQLAAVLLIGPAVAAGSITDEKAAGTLEHLLIAPLSDRDLAWGKWLAYCVQASFVLLPGVPAVALLAGLAGVGPWETLAVAAWPFAAVPGVVAASLLASAWARRTTTALTALYLLLAPAAALAVAYQVGPWWWLTPALPCVLLAGATLRQVHFRQVEAPPSARRVALPPVGDDALGWREAWIGGRGLPLLGAVPRWVGVPAVAGVAYLGHLALGSGMGLQAALLAGLLVAVRASASISGERERRTWDDVLLMPLTTAEVLEGKLWGTLRAVMPYQVAYLAGGLLAWREPGWVLAFWALSWPLLYFDAAVGLECSARAAGSWQALALALLGWGATLFFQAMIMLFLLLLAFGGVFFAVARFGPGWAGEMLARVGPGPVVLAFAVAYLGLLAILLVVNGQEALRQAHAWIEENERVRQPVIAEVV